MKNNLGLTPNITWWSPVLESILSRSRYIEEWNNTKKAGYTKILHDYAPCLCLWITPQRFHNELDTNTKCFHHLSSDLYTISSLSKLPHKLIKIENLVTIVINHATQEYAPHDSSGSLWVGPLCKVKPSEAMNHMQTRNWI